MTCCPYLEGTFVSVGYRRSQETVWPVNWAKVCGWSERKRRIRIRVRLTSSLRRSSFGIPSTLVKQGRIALNPQLATLNCFSSFPTRYSPAAQRHSIIRGPGRIGVLFLEMAGQKLGRPLDG